MAGLGLGVRGFGSQFDSGAASSEGVHVRRADCKLLGAESSVLCGTCVCPASQPTGVHWRAGSWELGGEHRVLARFLSVLLLLHWLFLDP